MDNASLEKLTEAALAREGMELVSLERGHAGKKALLRFFIDRLDGATVTIGDCQRQSDVLGSMLDMENAFPAGYVLEVSSPGLDRLLKKPEHFIRFAGHKAKVFSREPIEGRAYFCGLLKSADQTGIVMALEDGKEVPLQYGQIKQARLEPELDY
ncbi:MAG TPA: ribosome maturation factor RimP [Elusimicrobiales bacterium]|nr:ribosome maturation factor RimP [Elusimicrobiales bacterium]